jgi:hypothetical protein
MHTRIKHLVEGASFGADERLTAFSELERGDSIPNLGARAESAWNCEQKLFSTFLHF